MGSSTAPSRPAPRPGAPSWSRTFVVCGDSTASALGLPVDSIRSAYPARLKSSLRSAGFRVISHARPDRPIATTLAELDRVVALDPDVILISHGGLENTVRWPRALRYLPVPPLEPGVRRRPLHRLRRIAYLPVLAALQRPASARLLARAGLGPLSSAEPILREYGSLVAQLLRTTRAHLLLVTPPTGTMRSQPWSEEGLDALGRFLHRLAATSSRVTVIDLRHDMAGLPVHQEDGTHLSAAGHARAFELVRAALRPSMLTPRDTAVERRSIAV